ncbi:hypothetical protein ACA910_008065 [Epithemia clementina (nom. ined.)]
MSSPPPSSCDILLRNCILLPPPTPSNSSVSETSTTATTTSVDIAIKDGIITAMSASPLPETMTVAYREIDLKHTSLVSPPFVESHIHLDSVMTAGEPRWNESGTLFEGIDIWRERKQSLTVENVKHRALQALKEQAQQGVLFVRTHADVSEANLVALRALLEVRDLVQDWMTVQVVAFPQDGLYNSNSGHHHDDDVDVAASKSNEELLEQALQMGADVVGGIPHYELTREDGVRSVHRIFELAQQYSGRMIDIHCDETDDDQSRFLEVVAACAIRSHNGPRVTASHTTAFGSYNNAYALKLLGILERAQINLVSNPLINMTLQGRTDTYPKRRGLTRIKELWERRDAGINVSLGHDCIQDPWYSLGCGNMLDVAHMAIHASQMTGLAQINACYDMITWNGAKTLHIPTEEYGIDVGKPANLIVLNGTSRYDVLRRRATVQYVISKGKLICETSVPTTTWMTDIAPAG